MTVQETITQFVRGAAWETPFRGRAASVFTDVWQGALYSYGYHMPLAKVLDSRTGDLLVNEGAAGASTKSSSIVRYGSATTARHARYVAGALVALGYERASDGPEWECWPRAGGRCRTGVYTRG